MGRGRGEGGDNNEKRRRIIMVNMKRLLSQVWTENTFYRAFITIMSNQRNSRAFFVVSNQRTSRVLLLLLFKFCCCYDDVKRKNVSSEHSSATVKKQIHTIIITYTYYALIDALSAHIIQLNLNTILYTHVEYSPTNAIYVKYMKQKTTKQTATTT